VAGHLLRLRYARNADKVYFHGSSNGGKEALAMIQKYPSDIDGAMIFWPAAPGGRCSRSLRASLAP
jgi:predicted esterase